MDPYQEEVLAKLDWLQRTYNESYDVEERRRVHDEYIELHRNYYRPVYELVYSH